MYTTIKALIAATCLTSAAVAMSNTVTSNEADCIGNPITRVFSVTATTVVKCLMKGNDNIGDGSDPLVAIGWSELDQTGEAGPVLITGVPAGLTSGLSGTFNIVQAVFDDYAQVAVGFKVGGGQFDPVWAIFELADNTLSGSWSVSGSQELSHVVLYGKGIGDDDGTTDDDENPVPEPGTLALVGLGMLGADIVRRHRR